MRAWLALALVFLLQCHSSGPSGFGKNELRIATRGTLNSPDPYKENSVVAFSVYSNIYEPLIGHDSDLKIRPVLASEWSNPDDLTWLITLRPGVHFSDGTRFTAEDARASLERARDPETSVISDALWMIDRIEVESALTLKITTRTRYVSLLSNLAEVLILPARFVAPERIVSVFAPGTGPYQVRDWKPGAFVQLVRNDGYWGGRPELQSAKFMSVPQLQERIDGLKDGKYDILPQLEPAVWHDEALRQDRNVRLNSQAGLGVIYLGMDLQHEQSPCVQAEHNPFMDRRVRQALYLAIDEKHIVKDILENFADEMGEMVSPLVFGFNPAIVRPKFDPVRAKALLSDAGFAGGFTVRFDFSKDRYRNDEQIGRSIASDLEKVGIHVQANPLPRQQLFDLVQERKSAFYMMGWFLTNGDASNFFDYLVHTRDEARRYGSENAGGYSNPEMDAQIEASVGIMDPSHRAEALREMMRRTMEDLPYIPLHAEQNFCAYSASLDWQPRSDEYIFVKDIRRK